MVDPIELANYQAKNYFAADYCAARRQFLTLTGLSGFQVASHEIAAKGPAGEPLFIDVATRAGSGSAARRTVIVSSGLHGVEGFLGSAVQCAELERIAKTASHFSTEVPNVDDRIARQNSPLSLALSPETGARGPEKVGPRLVFVHALNPYGFAWIRRCNEDNVDLNRNFPVPGNGYRGLPADYGRLDWLLNKRSPPSRWEPFRLFALIAILLYGIPRLKRAIATGQYEYPRGLFYGGSAACETTRFVQSQFEHWLGDSADVLHLDFHTGLGEAGNYQFLADVPPNPAQARRIRKFFGREVLCGQQSAAAYSARGSISEWCQTAAGERDYIYLCAEFGTHPATKVLTALRAENRAQQWDRPGTESYRWGKELLMEAFCPGSPSWRYGAVERGMDLIYRATLCSTAPTVREAEEPVADARGS